jgi:3-deoxy-7-phosphoheptulonate synthase
VRRGRGSASERPESADDARPQAITQPVGTIATMSAGPSEQLDHVRDQRIAWVTGLISPGVLMDEQPLAPSAEEFVLRGRAAVADVLNRVDDRLLVVVGPCSVHDPEAALDYAHRLSATARELKDDLLVVMRVYFEKPRTTTGWKGLINDPHLDDTGDVNEGLRLARKLLLQVLELDLPVGCEFLDPITPQYIADAVSWGAIGARTTESQIHRQLASGLSMPVGFKNRTDGNVAVAVDAVRAAAVPHTFAGIDIAGTPAVLNTRGNPDCHVILRGGRGAPNYGADGVADALERLRAVGLPERVVIDASHDNSGKDHNRQPIVVEEIAAQLAAGQHALVGVMLESFIVAGRQDLKDGVTPTYGQSITDACMSWETSVETLHSLAKAVRERRASGTSVSA